MDLKTERKINTNRTKLTRLWRELEQVEKILSESVEACDHKKSTGESAIIENSELCMRCELCQKTFQKPQSVLGPSESVSPESVDKSIIEEPKNEQST